MNPTQSGLIQNLMSLPVFQAEWVLWLLIAVSVVSVAVIVERFVFLGRHAVDSAAVRASLERHLARGDFQAAAEELARFDSLETNVVLYGLRRHAMGPDAVQDLLVGAERQERGRFEQRLSILATVASNAPFVGLFGTVLGIIRAFNDLSGNMANASGAVMAGIAEALIATAVGLLVAIPAVIAFNALKGRVRRLSDNAQLLSGILLAALKADLAPRLAPAPVRGEEG